MVEGFIDDWAQTALVVSVSGTAMMDQTAWSISLGRWLGVPVRLHLMVVLFGLVTMAFAWSGASLVPGISGAALATVAGFGWLSALLIHEIGHRFVAGNCGCDLHRITLMPWGGLIELPPIRGWNRVAIFSAGPAANGLAALCGAFLSVIYFGSPLGLSFFDPLRPDRLLESQSLVENGVRVAIWMNAMLCVVNMTPVMVFDGGHILLGIVQALAPRASVIDRTWIVRVVGQSAGFAAVALAVVLGSRADGALLQGWFYLLLFGISVMFAARSNGDELGSETSRGLVVRTNINSLRRLTASREVSEFDETLARLAEAGVAAEDADDEFDELAPEEEESEESLSTWLKERQSERVEQARKREADEERLSDQILDKVHREGMQSLSTEERELLERVSARFRNRSRSRQGEEA